MVTAATVEPHLPTGSRVIGAGVAAGLEVAGELGVQPTSLGPAVVGLAGRESYIAVEWDRVRLSRCGKMGRCSSGHGVGQRPKVNGHHPRSAGCRTGPGRQSENRAGPSTAVESAALGYGAVGPLQPYNKSLHANAGAAFG